MRGRQRRLQRSRPIAGESAMTSSEPANLLVSFQEFSARGVFRNLNLASATLSVEDIGEITKCSLFDDAKAAVLLPRLRRQQVDYSSVRAPQSTPVSID